MKKSLNIFREEMYNYKDNVVLEVKHNFTEIHFSMTTSFANMDLA